MLKYTLVIFLTVRQNQRFVGVDALHDAEVRGSLEGQFDAFSPEDVQELDVVQTHLRVGKAHRSCWPSLCPVSPLPDG